MKKLLIMMDRPKTSANEKKNAIWREKHELYQISQTPGARTLLPHTFLQRINVSVVKITPSFIKNSRYLFHKAENVKISYCLNSYSH